MFAENYVYLLQIVHDYRIFIRKLNRTMTYFLINLVISTPFRNTWLNIKNEPS